jgi:uncharacterized membrane protein YhaH (DUF805 family)
MIKHLRRTLSLDGRLNRLGYWRWQLALTCISAAALVGSTLLAMNGAPKLVSGLVLGAIGLAIAATIRSSFDGFMIEGAAAGGWSHS